ncbi:MAG: hypothetical protein WC147_12515, partial [Syntrophomonas sp.]
MQLILIAVLIFVSCLSWVGLNHIFANQIAIRARLNDIGINNTSRRRFTMDDELQVGFMDRIVKPLLGKISVITQKYTPV